MPPAGYITDEHLDECHRLALHRAISNALSTELALTTYAQIVDGLPIESVCWDQRQSLYHVKHPVNQHRELCPGVLEKTREIRENFDLGSLKFSPELLQAYQSATPSSRGFHLRLVELAAASLHQIAILLFNADFRMHDPTTTGGSDVDAVTKWKHPPSRFGTVEPDPTLFCHPSFTAVEQYPDGLADMAGYWAEDRILGGVPLFDRSRHWSDSNPEPNLYFHSARYRTTYFIYQLLDEQQDNLMTALARDPLSSIFDDWSPIVPGSRNRVRIKPGPATETYKIYRDPWERVPYREPRYDRDDCCLSSIDYPDYDLDADIARFNESWERSQ